MEPTLPSPELNSTDLVREWLRVGVDEGMTLIVHSSLSSLGRIQGGAATVVESLCTAVGSHGTLAMPAFTRQVADPHPVHAGVPSIETRQHRDAIPAFHAALPSSMGAIPEALRSLPTSVRSCHPQASVVAVGAHAAEIVADQSLGFALGRRSPFGHLHDLRGYILLIGVGHNRNTFLHHAETLTPNPRLKMRRFPWHVMGERVWIETLDVGNDNDTYFPLVGEEFEAQVGIRTVTVGNATCRLLPIQPFVSFATQRLTELLACQAA